MGLAVTAVWSPSKLHIQLKIMQDMMGKLTEAIGNEIKVGVEGELRPMETRVVRVVAALISGGHWYRVMVLRMKEVPKYSYMILGSFSLCCLRYLSKRLSQVPAQAITVAT